MLLVEESAEERSGCPWCPWGKGLGKDRMGLAYDSSLIKDREIYTYNQRSDSLLCTTWTGIQVHQRQPFLRFGWWNSTFVESESRVLLLSKTLKRKKKRIRNLIPLLTPDWKQVPVSDARSAPLGNVVVFSSFPTALSHKEHLNLISPALRYLDSVSKRPGSPQILSLDRSREAMKDYHRRRTPISRNLSNWLISG